MAVTQVPDVEFTPEGLVLPTEAAILAGVQADQSAAFGGGMNPALETSQGQVASTTTAIIGQKNNLFAEYVNQVNPNFAEGRMQDAIGAIYFIDRIPGTPTAVVATCIGLAGTVISVGARAQASDGSLYLCTQAGTIPVSGTIDLTFACSVNGPTPCPAGTLNQIYQSIPGWDSINNAGDGVVGGNVETRAEFESRRQASVAVNAIGSLPSIYGKVLNVAGVIDAYVTENDEDTPEVMGGFTLVPHSIYVAAVGGAAADIAAAIWSKKSCGANYNGNTSFTVSDMSGYAYPYPQYVVMWETPAPLPIKFAVQIANNPSLPSDIIAQATQALIDAFNGLDGGQRARIGSTIFSSRYYAPIVNLNPSVSILSLLLGPTAPTLPSYTVPISNAPVVSAADISVTLV